MISKNKKPDLISTFAIKFFKMKIFFPGLALAGCLLFNACKNEDENSAATITRVFSDSSKYTTVEWLDTAVNFGVINMAEKKKITFRCKNTGNMPLYLSDVRPSCGCTLADYTKEAIAPGKEGAVTAEFDSNKSHPGSVRKTVYVHTNTTNVTPPYLIFTGEIIGNKTDSTTKK